MRILKLDLPQCDSSKESKLELDLDEPFSVHGEDDKICIFFDFNRESYKFEGVTLIKYLINKSKELMPSTERFNSFNLHDSIEVRNIEGEAFELTQHGNTNAIVGGGYAIALSLLGYLQEMMKEGKYD